MKMLCVRAEGSMLASENVSSPQDGEKVELLTFQ